jgi:hypothetical protein
MVFRNKSPLPKRSVVTELNMEKIHLQIMLSDVGESSFKESRGVLRRKGAGRPSTSQEDLDGIQEAWTFYVPRKARMLKFFIILRYLFYRK